MADDPVAVVKSAYAAFAVGDIPTVLQLIDPQVEWIETEADGIPTRGTHIGPDEVAQGVFAKVPESWSEFSIEPDDYFCDGDTVIVRGRVRATARRTGTEMDAPFVHVFTMQDGKVVNLTNHHDTALWLQTLGK